MPRSRLPREQVLEGVVVVLVEGCVDQRVEEGIGVAQPEEDAFPNGGDIAGAERVEEFCDEEGDPAEHKDPDEDAHHESGPLLLLLPPGVPVSLEGHCGVANSELRLWVLGAFLHLPNRNTGFRGTRSANPPFAKVALMFKVWSAEAAILHLPPGGGESH